MASCGDCIHRGWSVTGWQEPAHSGAPDVPRLMSVTQSVLQGPRATVVPDGLRICHLRHCTQWSGSGRQGQVEAKMSLCCRLQKHKHCSRICSNQWTWLLPGDGRKQLTQSQQKHSGDCGQPPCKQGGGRTLFSVADPIEHLEKHTIGTVTQQGRAVCPVLKLYMYLRQYLTV